jgi:DNA-binding NarL/FixJ family response regulator
MSTASAPTIVCPSCHDQVPAQRRRCPWCQYPIAIELTEHERQVVVDIASGLTTKEIAFKQGKSEKTIEYHRMQAQLRLRVRTAPQVFFTHLALARGWVKNLAT